MKTNKKRQKDLLGNCIGFDNTGFGNQLFNVNY
jgi:hypothetical protein